MSLERIVEEILARAEKEYAEEKARVDAELARLTGDRDRRLAQLREEGLRLSTAEAARERAQKVAAAKLEARKLNYLSRERSGSEGLKAVRELLVGFTESEEYPQVLKRMYSVATDSLGKQVKISGRVEDASVLRSIAGKGFDPTPVPVLGGLVAESPEGARRLNLTFDELLRLREDQVRSLLAR
ncbi:MAG: hypothetical protein L3K09_07905 [Thermoplasmata archaeon]|nr:hypothetical protein [Thermoplasmata archaeon]